KRNCQAINHIPPPGIQSILLPQQDDTPQHQYQSNDEHRANAVNARNLKAIGIAAHDHLPWINITEIMFEEFQRIVCVSTLRRDETYQLKASAERAGVPSLENQQRRQKQSVNDPRRRD